MKKVITAAAVIITGLFLSVLTVYFLIPSDMIEGRINEALSRNTGLVMTSERFSRTLVPGIKAEGLSLKDPRRGGELVYFTTFRAVTAPASLLAGRLRVNITGDTGGGTVTGHVTATPGVVNAVLDADGIDTSLVSRAFATNFIPAGLVKGRVELTAPRQGCPEGYIKATATDMDEETITYMGFAIPVGKIDEAGMDVELAGCKALVKGLWVDGENISARVTGTVHIRAPLGNSPVDLTLEIIPKGKLASDSEKFFFLQPYRKSANFYSAAIKGTVNRPVVRP